MVFLKCSKRNGPEIKLGASQSISGNFVRQSSQRLKNDSYHIEAAVLHDEHANHECKHGRHVDAEKVARGFELQTVGRAIAIVGLDVELREGGGGDDNWRPQWEWKRTNQAGMVVEQYWNSHILS